MQKLFSIPLLGLSKKERQVFTALKNGCKTPLEVHQATDISRTAVYHIMTVLKDRGLVKRYKEGGKHYVRVASTSELGEVLYETKKDLLSFVDGKEEMHRVQDSEVVVHRGVEAMKSCLYEAFTKNKNQKFIGVQSGEVYKLWSEIFGTSFVNDINALIKKNNIIVEGVLPEGAFRDAVTTFDEGWAEEYMGRMANIHEIDAKYFRHTGEVFIFKDVTYLLTVKDLLIVEIRHSDIAIAITMLIKYITDTTRVVDVNRRVRELVGAGR